MSEKPEQEIAKCRAIRKEQIEKISALAGTADAHIENGSFEMVEQALVECQEQMCEMKETMRQDRKKRRARNDTVATTSPPG